MKLASLSSIPDLIKIITEHGRCVSCVEEPAARNMENGEQSHHHEEASDDMDESDMMNGQLSSDSSTVHASGASTSTIDAIEDPSMDTS